jgi:hypothetical protein
LGYPQQDWKSARVCLYALEASVKIGAALSFDPTDEAIDVGDRLGVAGVLFECFLLEYKEISK